jgi:Ca2+-binding EF-hand superfamily protein
LEDLFRTISEKKGTIDQKQLTDFLASGGFGPLECVGIFNHLDFDKKGKISQEYFINEAKRHMKGLARQDSFGKNLKLPGPNETK